MTLATKIMCMAWSVLTALCFAPHRIPWLDPGLGVYLGLAYAAFLADQIIRAKVKGNL